LPLREDVNLFRAAANKNCRLSLVVLLYGSGLTTTGSADREHCLAGSKEPNDRDRSGKRGGAKS